MTDITIKAKKNSSILVIVDGEVKADLCRCGQSKAMPLCDDTHKTCGFVAEESIINIDASEKSDPT